MNKPDLPIELLEVEGSGVQSRGAGQYQGEDATPLPLTEPLQ